MSADAEPGAGSRLQDWAEDFTALVARPYSSSTTMVLNAANEPPTAYAVDVEELDCNCQFGANNAQSPKICKHVAKAILVMPDFDEATDLQVHDLNHIVERAAQASRELMDARDQAQTAQAADVAHAASEAGSDDAQPGDDDPVALLDRALEDANIPPGDVDAWIDDEYNSLQFRADGLDDDAFDRFRDWCKDIDKVNWDANNRRNYIKQDDIGRVLG